MKKLLSIVCLLASSSCLAEQHQIGVDSFVGVVDGKLTEGTDSLNDIVTQHYLLSYQYKLTDNWDIKAGYLFGDSEDFGLIFDEFTDTALEYTGPTIGVTGKFDLTRRNSLFMDVNTINYDYEMVDDGRTKVSETGWGYTANLGWQYAFDNGFGIKAAYGYSQFGDDVDIGSFSFGVSYRFGS